MICTCGSSFTSKLMICTCGSNFTSKLMICTSGSSFTSKLMMLCILASSRLMVTIVLTFSWCARTSGYFRYNLTCYDCKTNYTGDACHVVTRLTPRTTVYNTSENELLFCRFFNYNFEGDGGYDKVRRDFVRIDWNDPSDWKYICSCPLPENSNHECKNCKICQRDLCNTGLHTGRNYDVDGFYGNGSLNTSSAEKRYDQPVFGTLINLYRDTVLKIPKKIYYWFKSKLSSLRIPGRADFMRKNTIHEPPSPE
ncbi:hypothetical protein WDU94_001582 [Cyamophila willieti]